MQSSLAHSADPMLNASRNILFTVPLSAASSDNTQRTLQDLIQRQADEIGVEVDCTITAKQGIAAGWLLGVRLNIVDQEKVKEKGCRSWAEILLKVIFVPAAACACVFYWNYAKGCLKRDECLELVNIIPGGNDVKFWTLLISGGSGFAFTNIVFAFRAASALCDYLKDKGVLKASITLSLYTTLQVAAIIFGGLGEEEAELMSYQVLLPALAIIPTAIYSATAAANSSLTKYLWAELKQALTALYEYLVPALTERQVEAREERKHYRKEFKRFQQQLHFSRQRFFSDPKAIINLSREEIDLDDSFLSQDGSGIGGDNEEMKIEEMKTEESKPQARRIILTEEFGYERLEKPFLPMSLFNTLAYLFAIGGTTIFSGSLVINTFQQAKQMGEWAEGPMQYVTTSILGPISNIPNYELTVPAMVLFLQLLVGKLPSSIDLKLYPVKTTLIAAVALLSQFMSYAAIDGLFEGTYDGPIKNELRWLAWAHIIMYHTAGVTKVGLGLLRSIISDPIANFAFHIENVYDQLKWTTFDTFVKSVIEMGKSDRAEVGVNLFEEQPVLPEPKNPPIPTLSSDSSSPRNSWLPSWCNWFRCKRHTADVEDQHEQYTELTEREAGVGLQHSPQRQ